MIVDAEPWLIGSRVVGAATAETDRGHVMALIVERAGERRAVYLDKHVSKFVTVALDSEHDGSRADGRCGVDGV